jgi:hypothetical protein
MELSVVVVMELSVVEELSVEACAVALRTSLDRCNGLLVHRRRSSSLLPFSSPHVSEA